jgi:hypothetical protein
MPLQSAHGGHVYNGPTQIPNERWSANWRVRDAEVTQSDSGGCTLGLAVVQDNEWEFFAARDDTFFPEAVGLTPGTILSAAYFKLGAGTKSDKITNTLVLEVNPVNDNKGDVVRVTVRGKYGKVFPNVNVGS